MRVLDATVETVDAAGANRIIPISELHLLPGNTPQIETNLRVGEIITSVTLPPPPPGVQIYRKVRDRASYAFALVSVAAVVDTVGTCTQAINCPVLDTYDSISWFSLLVPLESVNKISLPFVCAEDARLESLASEISTGKFVRLDDPDTCEELIVIGFR